jgi:hypothetical protein
MLFEHLGIFNHSRVIRENTEKARRSQRENIKESTEMHFEHWNNKRGFGEMKTERI